MAFYNAFFLDHDDGAVYFNVLANGVPYLMGTERLKGSHSMSGYHSFELCYLAQVYTNLLITGQPLDLYFKPQPKASKGNILRVAPDLLPPGSIGSRRSGSTASRTPTSTPRRSPSSCRISELDLRVRVRVAPTRLAETFTVETDLDGATATLTLYGTLAANAVPLLQRELSKVIAAQPSRLIVDASDLKSIDPVAVRALVFAKQRLSIDIDVYVVGALDTVLDVFHQEELDDEVTVVADFASIPDA